MGGDAGVVRIRPQPMLSPTHGGSPRRLTTHSADEVTPSWSHGKWLYFASNRGGEFQIWKTSASTGESASTPAPRVTRGGGFGPVESPDGKYLYFGKSRKKPALGRLALARGTDRPGEMILESLQDWGQWAIGAHGIYFFAWA